MEQFGLRTTATLVSADKFDDRNSPFLPTAPIKVAPFIREPTDVPPLTPIGLGLSNIRFEIPKTNGDNVTKIWLSIDWNLLNKTGGTATFARYCDYLGICCIREIRIKYGTQTLQTIHKEHLYIWQQKYLATDQAVLREQKLVKGNLPADQRKNFFKKAFRTKTQIYNAFFADDMSKALQIQGLSQKLTVEVDTEPDNNLIQQDGTSTGIFQASSASYMSAMNLHVEYNHVLMGERALAIGKYIHPKGLRYLFHDFQECPPITIPAATATTGGQFTANLQNLSFPTHSIFLLLRWTGDMARTCNAAAGPSDAGGQGGRDWTNTSGWIAPVATPIPDTSGPPTPLIASIQIKSGNNYICKPVQVTDDLLVDWAGRYYPTQPVSGIISIPYAHSPTSSNACMGGPDMSVIDQPQLIITWASSPNGFGSVGDYANADIGDATSGLRIDVIAGIYNNVDILNHDAYKPF
jgi:hypothetical protein